MPKNYEDWGELTTAVQERCSKILDKKVAPIAKKIVKEHIKTDIYDAYTPKENGWVTKDGKPTTYERRMLFFKRDGIFHKFTNTRMDEIIVTSNVTASPAVVKGWSFHTHGRPGSFLKLLESGNMGIWTKGFPRPAISNAQEDINTSTLIETTINTELNK